MFRGLGELEPGDERFGGKARGLARLVRVGVAVPDGFAIAARRELPEQWPESERTELARRLGELLAAGPVAVRSSALGEDSAERSFAGLFVSRLGVGSNEEAVAAVAACIASGGTERVLSYAQRSEPMRVGVVVQRMVPAAAAGVLFTREPNGSDPGLHLEAVRGLGEELVAGHRRPQRFRVYRNGLGELELECDDDGDEVLGEAEVERLATEAWRIEGLLGEPLDLEWARTGAGELFWLQARPVTTGQAWRPLAVDRSSPDADDGPVSVWGNWNVRETLPEPIRPLTWSIWSETVVPIVSRDLTGIAPGSPAAAHSGVLDRVEGRAYFNMNALLAGPVLGPVILRLLHVIDPVGAATAEDLVRRGVLRPRRLPGSKWLRAFGVLGVGLRSLLRLARFGSPRRGRRALRKAADRIVLAAPALATSSDRELLAELRVLGSERAGALRDGLAMTNVSYFVWMFADRLFSPWPDARAKLLVGVPDNPTTQISVGIDDLVTVAKPIAEAFTAAGDEVREDGARLLVSLRARRDDPEVAAWLEALDRFLDRFGHRAPQEFDLAKPRWADDASMVVELVRSGLASPSSESLLTRLERLRREREWEIANAIRLAPFWRRPLMRWAANAVLVHMPMRETPKDELMRVFRRQRQAVLELGRRLRDRGLVVEPDDVFFLFLDEVDALVGADASAPECVPALVAERRDRHVRWAAMRPPDYLRSDGVPVAEPVEADSSDLSGLGVGGGSGTGRVRILTEPDPGQLQAGEVLVVRFADPGWTPLFPRAAALVMEVGGAMCHAAVVARELGIPAVFGVRRATEVLADGEWVEVDGDRGIVTRSTRS